MTHAQWLGEVTGLLRAAFELQRERTARAKGAAVASGATTTSTTSSTPSVLGGDQLTDFDALASTERAALSDAELRRVLTLVYCAFLASETEVRVLCVWRQRVTCVRSQYVQRLNLCVSGYIEPLLKSVDVPPDLTNFFTHMQTIQQLHAKRVLPAVSAVNPNVVDDAAVSRIAQALVSARVL
jgi:hypothetical protein